MDDEMNVFSYPKCASRGLLLMPSVEVIWQGESMDNMYLGHVKDVK